MQDWVGRYQLDAAAATAELLTLIAQVGSQQGRSLLVMLSRSSVAVALTQSSVVTHVHASCRQLAAMLKSPRRRQRTERWTSSWRGYWRLPCR